MIIPLVSAPDSGPPTAGPVSRDPKPLGVRGRDSLNNLSQVPASQPRPLPRPLGESHTPDVNERLAFPEQSRPRVAVVTAS